MNRYCEQCTQTLRPEAAACVNCGAAVTPVAVAAPSKTGPFVFWGAVAASSCAGAAWALTKLAVHDPVAYGPILVPVLLMIVLACIVCALMTGAPSEKPRAAWKPAPEAPKPAPRKFSPEQRKEMDRLKLMNRVGMAGFVGALAAAGVGAWSAGGDGRFMIISLIALVPCALVTIVALYGIRTFICPNCGQPFGIVRTVSRRGSRENGRHCVHCMFDAYTPDV